MVNYAGVGGTYAAYTDSADQRIHYCNFLTGVDASIPAADGEVDTLPDVNGRISTKS